MIVALDVHYDESTATGTAAAVVFRLDLQRRVAHPVLVAQQVARRVEDAVRVGR